MENTIFEATSFLTNNFCKNTLLHNSSVTAAEIHQKADTRI